MTSSLRELNLVPSPQGRPRKHRYNTESKRERERCFRVDEEAPGFRVDEEAPGFHSISRRYTIRSQQPAARLNICTP